MDSFARALPFAGRDARHGLPVSASCLACTTYLDYVFEEEQIFSA